ncbi:MAG: ribosome recycling factor [Bdellovibrionales bacterium]|nr:ribosome recycling factor [Bdellovibrionales bacterium]
MSDIQQDSRQKMEKAVTMLKSELSKLRTGRASPSLVEHIKIDYYGTPTPLNQVGQVSIPDPKTIQIASWDQSAIPLIEKAIIAANIGLTPNVDGKLIRLNVPPLTEERRKDIAKTVKKIGEDSKVAVRNVRREANDVVKAQEKDKALSEDAAKKLQEQIQKVTDAFIADIDKLVESKTKDIMTV